MVDHIVAYIDYLRDAKSFSPEHIGSLLIEIEKLDPKDFEGDAQWKLMNERANFRFSMVHKKGGPAFLPYLDRLKEVLSHYKGAGSGGIMRSFAFIHDAGLKTIIERDYADVVLRLFPSRSWKSVVIIAGSILEAILFDRLFEPAWQFRARADVKAPKNRAGTVLPDDDWKLSHLIDVASSIGRLPADPANTIHQVLRDYRNFVHPKKEIRAAHDCTQAEAMLSVGALDSVCNYLEKHY